MKLLDGERLARSSVVANSRMNRDRVLTGGNGYAKELGFNPLDWLAGHRHTRWLDLCCGAGRALAEAGAAAPTLDITGVDLAGLFVDAPPNVKLVEASLETWKPDGTYGLITCVHGLHYVGDKLGALARAAAWLSPRGLLVANLDLTNVKVEGLARAAVARALALAGFGWNARRRLVTAAGAARPLPFEYLGADDGAGPNYTGQPAVDSHYRQR